MNCMSGSLLIQRYKKNLIFKSRSQNKWPFILSISIGTHFLVGLSNNEEDLVRICKQLVYFEYLENCEDYFVNLHPCHVKMEKGSLTLSIKELWV